MKKIYTFLLFTFFICLLNACKKEEAQDISFNVSVAKNIFNVKDSVQFNVEGNPDVISFYSGEVGHNFNYKDRTLRTDGVLKLSFQIRCDDPTGFTAIANGNFKVLVTNNFTAAYSTSAVVSTATTEDSALVNKTTWTDISSRFTLPKTGTISTFYTVTADLSDIANLSSNPLYFAFKCDGNSFGSLGANGITIGSLSLTSNYADGSVTNYNLVPGGTVSTTWKVLKLANALNSWATSSTQLKFTSALTTDYSEDWAISNGFTPSLAAPDVAVPLKNITNKPITTYKYKFAKAGDYKVVFMASNNTPNSVKVKLKEIYLTINP
jgi:hypothetical protein